MLTKATAIVTFYFCATFLNSAFAEYLTAVRCNEKLPTPRDGVSAVYDGDDGIYLFGGYDGSYLREALKYSISEDKLEVAGTLPEPSYYGGSFISNNNIFHIAGYSPNAEIYQYLPELKSFATVSNLTNRSHHFSTVQIDLQTVLLIGGWNTNTDIVRFNVSSLQTEKIADLPGNRTTDYEQSSIWVPEKEAVYIFTGHSTGNINITKYFPSNNSFHVVPTKFPRLSWGSQAVYDGRYGYLFGLHSDELSGVEVT